MMSADNDEVLGNDAKGSSSQDLRKLSHVKVHCVCGRPDAYIRPPRTEGSEGEEFPVKAKRRVFGLLVVLNIAVQYDTGALAATISDTSDKGVLHEFGLSQGELGLLVSVAHLGVAAGCLLCGPSLQRYPARHLLRGATLVNTVTALLFAFSPTYWLLIASRVLNGLSQAFLIVFAPMWTDEFAPESSKSTWMAASEAGGPIGIVIGYLMSGLFLANTSLSWRYPFYIQAFCLLVLTVLGFFVKAHHLQVQQLDKCTRSKPRPSECPTKRCRVIEVLHEGNSRSPSTVVTVTPPMDTPRKMSWAVHTAELDNEDKPSDALEGETTCSCILCQPEQCQSDYRQRACSFCVEEEPAPPPESKLYAWWVVATNGQVWAALMALSSLYFVVTGLQMWVTAYLTDDTGQIRANPNTVIICFGCSAATAP
ncbi:putative sphingolipid transporter spinster-like protein 1, partial [Diplonema papillatum]